MKTPQNVTKMSTVSPDFMQRDGDAAWLMAATTIERSSSFLHSTNSLCFSSTTRH